MNYHYTDVIMTASQFTRRLDCLLSCLFRRRAQKASKLRVTGLCEGNPPMTGGFLSQRTSNAENVSIWWCHHLWRKFEPKPHFYKRKGLATSCIQKYCAFWFKSHWSLFQRTQLVIYIYTSSLVWFIAYRQTGGTPLPIMTQFTYLYVHYHALMIQSDVPSKYAEFDILTQRILFKQQWKYNAFL